MSIEDWGWRLPCDQIIPVMTDLPAAPESLLPMVRCNCSSDCVSKRCTCRKYGLECSPALVSVGVRHVQIVQTNVIMAMKLKKIRWVH